jgi:hypothetical protein
MDPRFKHDPECYDYRVAIEAARTTAKTALDTATAKMLVIDDPKIRSAFSAASSTARMALDSYLPAMADKAAKVDFRYRSALDAECCKDIFSNPDALVSAANLFNDVSQMLIPHQYIPAAVLQAQMDTMVQPAPEIVAEPAPEIVAEPAPEIVAEPAPEIVAEPAPEIVAEPAPVDLALYHDVFCAVHDCAIAFNNITKPINDATDMWKKHGSLVTHTDDFENLVASQYIL